MRHYFRRRGGRRRSAPRPRIQHSPSTMSSAPATNTGVVIYAIVPDTDAGSSATASRISGTDRDRTVGTGSRVNSVNFNISIQGVAQDGFLELVAFKAERQFILPVKGTDPLPSDLDCVNQGCQQAYRMAMPGWIMKHIMIPVSAETANSKTFSVNLAKFRKAGWRDGDYFGIYVLNRTGGAATFHTQMRYYEYK